MDRRVQRTRQLLGAALLALIVEKGYAAITVQDILDRANLGRSTFYAHFRDKDDLLAGEFEHFKELFEQFDAQPPAEGQRRRSGECSLSLAFFRHAGEQHRLYKAMVGKSGGETVRKLLYQYISGLMKSHLEQSIPDDENMAVPREVVVHYFISSFLALLTYWLDNDMPYSPEKMDAMFQQLVMPGVKAALGNQK
ncbi:MAG: TetR/AcrR family transcriptional regulator [Chloroflexi bacterium]|nr:TetR/AcrR family transcriptional regulator [Chloroflexota bacterium]